MPVPRVLILVEWFLPGERAGGPVQTIDALVHRFEGTVHFDIATRDHDLGERRPYTGITPNRWLDGQPGRRRYLRRRDERPLALLRLLRTTPHDVLYLHTLFSLPYALMPLLFLRLGLLRARVLAAPSGQLHPAALAIRAPKKRAYLRVVRALGLLSRPQFHAAGAAEAVDIRRLLPDATVHIAPNLRRPQPVDPAAPSAVGTVRAVFLSRISPKKNLDGALRILARCQFAVCFSIYGPAEDAVYWAECQGLIADLPPHIACTYHGIVTHDDVGRVLGAHDVFFLPTHGENFGHVIGEALEAGCLALLSDRTPWRDLAAAGAGWDLPLEEADAFVAALESYAGADATQRRRFQAQAQARAARHDDDPACVAANLRLFA